MTNYGDCVYCPSNICNVHEKNVYEEPSVCCVGVLFWGFFFYMTLWTNKYFTPAVTTIKRFLNLKRRLISWRGRYVWKLGISPGVILLDITQFELGLLVTWHVETWLCASKNICWIIIFLSILDENESWRYNTCYQVEKGFLEFMPFTPGHVNHLNKTESNRYHKLLSMFLSRDRSKWYFWARFYTFSGRLWHDMLLYIILHNTLILLTL